MVSLTPFNNNPESSRDLDVLTISSVTSFDIISVDVPDLNIFLCMHASVTHATVVNPNGIKTL